jgi:8-oxo-dGTP pyrophosphatase MutT (NUDIX family)
MRGVLPDDLTPDLVAARLVPYRPVRPRGRTRRAAVAALLRLERGVERVLLIERAVNAADRWSGHVSFPGGHWEAGDADLAATVVRETQEEVGVTLAPGARLLGTLPAVRAIARGRILPMTIAPFVFALDAEPELRLGPEAAAAFWLPLRAAAGGSLDGTHTYRLGPLPLDLPCWRFEGHLIWGLTYQMLSSFLAALAAPAPARAR